MKTASRQAPKVGDTLFSLNVGNSARSRPQTLTPVKVIKVGRKFFTTQKIGQEYFETVYHLSTWQEYSVYSANSLLYATEQEYADLAEETKICETISLGFQYGKNQYKLPLPILRQVNELIASNNQETIK